MMKRHSQKVVYVLDRFGSSVVGNGIEQMQHHYFCTDQHQDEFMELDDETCSEQFLLAVEHDDVG